MPPLTVHLPSSRLSTTQPSATRLIVPRLRTIFNSVTPYVVMTGIIQIGSVRLYSAHSFSFLHTSFRLHSIRLPAPRLRTGLQLNQALRGDDWDYSAPFHSILCRSTRFPSVQPNTLGSSSVKNYLLHTHLLE